MVLAWINGTFAFCRVPTRLGCEYACVVGYMYVSMCLALVSRIFVGSGSETTRLASASDIQRLLWSRWFENKSETIGRARAHFAVLVGCARASRLVKVIDSRRGDREVREMLCVVCIVYVFMRDGSRGWLWRLHTMGGAKKHEEKDAANQRGSGFHSQVARALKCGSTKAQTFAIPFSGVSHN